MMTSRMVAEQHTSGVPEPPASLRKNTLRAGGLTGQSGGA